MLFLFDGASLGVFCCGCGVRLFVSLVWCVVLGLFGFEFLLILVDWFVFAACCYKRG